MSLSMMPPEIATNIFCQLPCFADVFALSTVCHRLRRLWLKNVTPIYNEMAPRNIPCEGAARRFLVDQDGPDLESPMSAKDVVRMLRNADVVENAILQFEREIVSRVRSEWRLLHIWSVQRAELTFKCNSDGLDSQRILWYAQPSSDVDSHRAPTLHPYLLLNLGSDET